MYQNIWSYTIQYSIRILNKTKFEHTNSSLRPRGDSVLNLWIQKVSFLNKFPLSVPSPVWHLDHFYSNVSQRTNRMSSLYKMNSNQIFCLTNLYIAAVLTDLGLKASTGFPYVRQTTGNQAFDLKSLSYVGVGKLVTFVCETALSTSATFVITLWNLVHKSFPFLWWIIRFDHNVAHVWGSFKDHTWGVFKDGFQ